MKTLALAVILVMGLTTNSTPTIEFSGNTYVVTGRITLETAQYRPLVAALNRASSKTTIHILIVNSPGGSVDTLEYLDRAIKRSKAKVVLEARGRIASAASLLLMSGNRAIVNKNANIMYHQFTPWNGKRDRKSYNHGYNWHKKAGVWQMLRQSQINSWKVGRDVWVRGSQLCHSVRLVVDYSTTCSIRGTK